MTVTAIALKVCASALKIFPQFNASIDMAKEEIIYKQYINIGVAVDTDRGLLVPVIRDVDKKNIVELAAELTQLSKKARDKKLTPGEMEGGTLRLRTSAASAEQDFRRSSTTLRSPFSGCRVPAWSRCGSMENLSRVWCCRCLCPMTTGSLTAPTQPAFCAGLRKHSNNRSYCRCRDEGKRRNRNLSATAPSADLRAIATM